MYALPGMQRSGNDENTLLTLFFYGLLLFVYEPLGSIYPFLPPLLGLAAWAVAAHTSWMQKGLWLLYLYLYEIDHGLFCCMLIASAIAVSLIYKRITHYIACTNCLKLVIVTLYYTFATLLLIFLSYIFNTHFNLEMTLILYYMILDLVVVINAK